MNKPRVFVTREILPDGLDLIRPVCDLDLWSGELPPPREELLRRVRGVDGLLCLLTDRVDAELLEAAGPGLCVVSNHAVGTDNVDLPALTARGIPLGNTPGILTDATADLAFTLLLVAARRVIEAERYVREGRWRTWSPGQLLGLDLRGATLGIVGFGRIGRAVAKRAAGFEMRVIYCDPSEPGPVDGAVPVDLETLLRESDLVSLHVPLTDATRGLIDAGALALMKPSAVLVNTARGAVVDSGALYESLRQGRIFAAALDVTDPEPLPADSPLLRLENLIVVPHIASASRASRAAMSRIAAENLLAGLRGERLPFCVNPEVYSRPK